MEQGKGISVAELSITVVTILIIATLEFLALMKGIDGRTLSIAIAIIALLAPSPVRWFLQYKSFQLGKGIEPLTLPKSSRGGKKSGLQKRKN